LLSTSALAAPGSISDAYKASLMSRCVDNGGLDPVAVQAMNDDALLKALTECANRNAAVASSPPSSPVVRSYARPRVATVAPDDGDGLAPVEVGTPLLDAVRNIVPNFIGNRFGGGSGLGGGFGGGGNADLGGLAGDGGFGGGLGGAAGGGGNGGPVGPVGSGGPVGGVGGASSSGGPGAPRPPVDPIDARISRIERAIDKGVKSGAITAAEAQVLGAQMASAKVQLSKMGANGGDRLAMTQTLDKLATNTNTTLHNNTGIPNPDLVARRAPFRPGTPGAVPGAVQPTGQKGASALQQKAPEAMKAKVGNKPTQLASRAREAARGTNANLQQNGKPTATKAPSVAARSSADAHSSKPRGDHRQQAQQRWTQPSSRSNAAVRATAPSVTRSQVRSSAGPSRMAAIARR
jgi:hypothetical protein